MIRISARDRFLGKGMLWTGMEKSFVYGINFVQGVILARLLNPEDFGLSAMLGIFMSVGATLATSGLGAALVVKGGDESRVFRWNLGVGISLYAVFAALSPFVARWYGIRELCPLMLVMSVSVVIGTLTTVPHARLQRAEQFGRITRMNCICAVFFSALVITLAWNGLGVWAIAFSGLIGTSFSCVLVWAFARHAPHCGAKGDEFKGLLAYGWKLMVSDLITNVYGNLYNVVVGKVWSPAQVGLFVRAYRWAWLPVDVANETVGRVALPDLAQGSWNARRFTWINCALLWPALLVLSVFAEPIVRLVLGVQWVACVPYLRILVFGAAASPVANMAHKVILASGHTGAILYADIVKRPVGIALLAFGCAFGMRGLCWAFVAGEVVSAAVNLVFALRIRRRHGHS